MISVFDASALIALAKRERGAEVVAALLADGSTQRIVHAINLCEVYYKLLQHAGKETADGALGDLFAAGLETDEDISQPLRQSVAHIEVAVGRVSLADCSATALARRVGGEVVTADHGEFDFVAAQGICRVRFIR